MKQENQIKVDSLNRDRDRLSMMQTLINQFENGNPTEIALELQSLRDRQNVLRFQIEEIKKIDLGLDVVENKLKEFIEENNLDWTFKFSDKSLSVRIGFHELMHDGIMSKFEKIFEWEFEEYDDDDCKTRFSYLVTDLK